ncbi:MAG TPA: DUF465 domain-containing protein [Thermodesulfobacteriota bacterium]|nr:DUF465 domain-containing protein [Thermodesulfobacteriota bacterium]
MNESGGNFLKGLLEGDSEFRRIYEAHRNYEKKAAKLSKKIYLTAAEAVEEKRLKKMKLTQKDRMEEMVLRHRD